MSDSNNPNTPTSGVHGHFAYPAGGSRHKNLDSQLHPAVFAFLRECQGREILELGCGNGHLAIKLSEAGYDVTAVEGSPTGIEQGKRASPNVRFHLFDVCEPLPFTECADVVISIEVIEHLFHPAALVRNACQALRKGGALILTTPYHGYWKNLALSLANHWDAHLQADCEPGRHIKFFSWATLKGLLEANGFHSISFRGVGRIPGFWKSMVVMARKSG